ncbi:MAG TPA: CotH kinase family protein, partial [Sedimentisphaerales bacterium]|nr:CotH kinase family protein [Sedimentisphaerales bacterium]
MFKSVCSSLLFLSLALAATISSASIFPPGDLDYNAKVDFEDIALFAQQWLEHGCQQNSLRNHWNFDERTSNFAYDSVSGNTGIISGCKWTDARLESGLSFDGDSFVDINDISLTNSWTISFWEYSTAPQGGLTAGSVIFGNHTDNNNCFYTIDKSKARFVNSGSGYVEWTTDTDFYKKWRFITLVGDVNSVELYLDGISQGKQLIDPEINITRIGTGHTDLTRNFIGILDDFRIYGEALNLEQIKLLNKTGISVVNCGDIDQSNSIDMDDFAWLAEYWQKDFGPVVINEFMASNQNCITDEFGTAADWIELYNPTNTPVDIGGMYLSDSSNTWMIPANDPDKTTINSHDYLLIWADSSPALGTLHADFKLSAGGESIILYENDGYTMVDSIVFGSQTTDVSFGRFPDLSDNWKFFSQPTPGKTNSIGYSGLSKPVNFSVKSKCFTEPLTVELTTTEQQATIYYTINGEFPDQASEKYTTPITIDGTTIIRAIAKNGDMAPSEPVTETYIQLSPEVADFNSNLPLFIIESFGDTRVDNSSNEEYIYNTSVFINTYNNERAYLTNPTEYFGRSGIRVRGSSTAGAAKHQYAFEIWDEYNEDKDASIFGLPSESDWVVQGPYSDKTLMRNYLVYNWSNAMGQYAPRVVYMEGFINTGGGPITMADYVGVFYLIEKIKRDKNRVAIEKLTPYDNEEPEITGGYIIKNDRSDPGETTGISSQMGTLWFHDPESQELTTVQQTYMRNYINTFQTALSSSYFDDPETGYAKYADPNTFIDSQILVELAKNIDGYRLSTFMHKDRGGKLKMGPAWDYNLSLGNANYGTGWTPVGWYYPLSPTAYTWYAKMFRDNEFYMNYIDRWFSLRKGIFATDALMNDIDKNAAYLDEAQKRNYVRWPRINQYDWPNPGWGQGEELVYNNPPLTYPAHIEFMKNWLKGRVKWIDNQFPKPPVFNQDGGVVNAGFELTIRQAEALPYLHKYIDYNDRWSYLDNGTNQKVLWSTVNYTGHNNWP